MAEQNFSYIFRCTNKTEQECFDRMLFGEVAKLSPTVLNIKKGDTLFLYNIETELLMGAFKAISDGSKNIEAEAWNGKFPYQVKVAKVTSYSLLSKKHLDGLIRFTYAFGKFNPQMKIEIDILKKIKKLLESINPDEIIFKKDILPSPTIRTDDGHRVRSEWEFRIDNWLTSKGILHYYEKVLNVEERVISDFYIPPLNGRNNPGIYIELWGKTDSKYSERKAEKIKIYEKYNLNLIQLSQNDMVDLNINLVEKLKKYGVL